LKHGKDPKVNSTNKQTNDDGDKKESLNVKMMMIQNNISLINQG